MSGFGVRRAPYVGGGRELGEPRTAPLPPAVRHLETREETRADHRTAPKAVRVTSVHASSLPSLPSSASRRPSQISEVDAYVGTL